MKWKCTECMNKRGNDNKGCIIDVPHLDDSMCGPLLCPWDQGTGAEWNPMNEPIDKAIEAATPRVCLWCEEPAIVNEIGLCRRCENESIK